MNNKTELTADLALYLGCEVEWTGERGYFLAGVNTGQENFNPVGLVSEQMEPVWVKYDEITPILRPLSDMTEDEKNEVLRICEKDRRFKSSVNYEAIRTRYLLSRHFDLFGWIDAGLAIDKTKTT